MDIHRTKRAGRRVSGRRVLRLTPPGGLAFHKDGRLFVAALDIPNGVGSVLVVNPDGSGLQTIIPPMAWEEKQVAEPARSASHNPGATRGSGVLAILSGRQRAFSLYSP